MKVTVRFFAGLRDLAGTGEVAIDLPDEATLDYLVPVVLGRFPALEGQEAAWHYAVNFEHIEPDSPLSDGDRVTIFPYVAGG